MFGRGALDELIQRTIPDEAFVPGELHRMLLTLPWSDVFTTNYDTLIERTLPEVWKRRYEVVVDPLDLPGHLRPRVIKLHGSFPAHRPYIITEEDYRTYPSRFAPFVNTVQQALIENVFLLLGFSGDDPNFLQWIGWVRDRLKHAVPPVYLCELLDLSPPRRQVLRTLNVITVDLSPLFPREQWINEPERQQRAMYWLLQSLCNGAPPYLLSWPEPATTTTDTTPGVGPPPLPNRHVIEPEIRRPPPQVGGNVESDLLSPNFHEIASVWRRKREQYPGWIVLPAVNRMSLWESTAEWTDRIMRAVEEVDPILALSLLRELFWRLSRIGEPLITKWTDVIERTLNRVPAFGSSNNETGEEADLASSMADIGYIRECWVEVAFALARRGRQDGDGAFSRWMSRLEPIVQQRAEWTSRWHYEWCLFHLYRCAPMDAMAELDRWPVQPQNPFGNTKRASILAELGQLGAAEELANAALAQIRRLQRDEEGNLALLSQEGWTMFLLNLLHNRYRGRTVDPDRGRSEQLAQYRCNPWTEVGSLRAKLNRLPPKRSGSQEERVHPFTARRSTTTYHPGGETERMRDAFALLSLLEDAAVPYRAGHTQVYQVEAGTAAQWIEKSSFHWASGVVLRTALEKISSPWFDKVRIASFSAEQVAEYVSRLEHSISQAISLLESQRVGAPDESSEYATQQLGIAPELLGRVVFRLADTTRGELLQKTLGWLSREAVQQNRRTFESFQKLLSMLVEHAGVDTWTMLLDRLLEFPIPGANFSVPREDRWPEPFAKPHPSGLQELDPASLGATTRATITRLLTLIRSKSGKTRKRAILRVDALWSAGLLTRSEQDEYGAALWTRQENRDGMPADSPFFGFAYLARPEPELGLAETTLRSVLLKQEFTRSVSRSNGADAQPTGWSVGSQPIQLAQEWLDTTSGETPDEDTPEGHIDWSPSEALALLQKITNWWDADRSALADTVSPPMWSDDALQSFSYIPDLLRKVVVPRVTEDEPAQQRIQQLLGELAVQGIPVLACRSALLRWSPDEAAGTAEAIHVGLRAQRREVVEDACQAVYRWAVDSIGGTLPVEIPQDLVAELVRLVAIRRPVAVRPALAWLSNLVRFAPSALTQPFLSEIGGGLDGLLWDTELPSEADRPQSDPSDPEYRRMIELPTLRGWGARLAGELSRQIENSRITPPDQLRNAINGWSTAVSKDVLPETRGGWEWGHREDASE